MMRLRWFFRLKCGSGKQMKIFASWPRSKKLGRKRIVLLWIAHTCSYPPAVAAGAAAAPSAAPPAPRARRASWRLNAEEPDLAELKSLFEAQPRAPRADDDAAGDDDDDDDGDLGSLFAPPPAREVSAAERDAFVASLKLEDIVDEGYARARETIEETADAQRQEEAAEVQKALDAAVAEVEKSEREALEALEGRVGALVDKVGAREADFEKAVRDARAAAGELEAFERDAGTYKLAAGGAAVLLLATTFLASQ